jgi:glucose-6-phosphate dehydrogenase assembly protein OpcA
VTAHCSFDRTSGRSLCSEQITFLLRGFGPTDLASIVFPHLLSDLPVVFWWQGDLNEQLISPLSRHIDRFLFDSSTWTDSRGCVLRLLERHHKRRKPFILHDLAWARTFAFRLALAEAFEEPAARLQLDRIRCVRLMHGPDGTAMAKLLLAWIATHTRWTCTSWQRDSLRLRHKTSAAVDCSVETSGEGTGLLEVDLESAEGAFRLLRRENVVELQVDLPGHKVTSFFPLQPSDPAALVSQILGRGGNNAVYLSVLRFLLDHFCPAE